MLFFEKYRISINFLTKHLYYLQNKVVIFDVITIYYTY
jgi:hypothetical protein